MNVPLQISYRNVPHSPELESLIREKADRLEEVCDHLSSCRVAVENAQGQRESGNQYRVRIDMTVPPGHELVVEETPRKGPTHEPLETLVRDAFETARRRLKDLVDKQRGDTKEHPQQEVAALVSQLFPEEDYGFLRTADGRDIYFHRNAVLHDEFDRMQEGTGVRFVEEMGDEGPQATTVQIITRPGPRKPSAPRG